MEPGAQDAGYAEDGDGVLFETVGGGRDAVVRTFHNQGHLRKIGTYLHSQKIRIACFRYESESI